MGALTLKSFPFELRRWDVDKFESIDITDSFCSKIRVYLYKNKIIQIEPEYDYLTKRSWLSDKGRQFFDSFYSKWDANTKEEKTSHTNASLSVVIKNLCLMVYFYDYKLKNKDSYKKFVIVFDNISLEVLSLLEIIKHTFSFIYLKKAPSGLLKNDLESNFKVTTSKQFPKWNSSDLCLLISVNSRYEGYYLNLNLRQRLLKGNFKCLLVGSLIDITFPVSFLGSTNNTLLKLAEGTHLNCQDLKKSKSPFVIFNSEFFKRNDNYFFDKISKVFNKNNSFSTKWQSLNVLVSSSFESNVALTSSYEVLSTNDLNKFNCLFLLNVNEHNLTNFKKIVSTKLLHFKKALNNEKKTIVNQNYKNSTTISNMFNLLDINAQKNYFYLTNTIFFENKEMHLSAEGKIVKTEKLLFRKKTRDSWQVLRKLLKTLKSRTISFNNLKDNSIVFFNCDNFNNFRHFIMFNYYATKSLNKLNFFLSKENCNFLPSIATYRLAYSKVRKTKLNYWLNDFFSGGSDEYSFDSLTLQKCSLNIRKSATNFF